MSLYLERVSVWAYEPAIEISFVCARARVHVLLYAYAHACYAIEGRSIHPSIVTRSTN